MSTIEGFNVSREEGLLEVARFLRELRERKQVTQGELADKGGVSRQAVSAIERGKCKKIDLVRLMELVNACGETLVLSTSDRKESWGTTPLEDEVLTAFQEGELLEAEQKLTAIRRWQYPLNHILGRCKRDMAVTMSYYFKGRNDLSHSKMNKIVMGLSLLGFVKEAREMAAMYNRILDDGEEQIEVKELAEALILGRQALSEVGL